MKNRTGVLTAFAVVIAALSAEIGQALVLVEDGVSRAPVVVFEGAPPATRRAAEELAGYIEKVSGARPPVLEGWPEPLPERAIWVGIQPALAELFPGVDLEFRHPEEILLAANEKHLVVAGRDRWDPALPVADRDTFQFGTRDVEGYQWEYGTANAVYTFLQDYLGVRWLWPGEEDVEKRGTIAFDSFEYRYHPQIRQRHSMFFYLAPYRASGRPGLPDSDWARFQRVQLDSLYAPVQGHGFADWWERFHETHPEYFALQPDGTRSGWPAPGYAKVCDANPAAWEQWLADVEEQLAKHPARTVFSASANDSWAEGHCICENCRAWDHQGAEMRMYRWQGLAQKYVVLSERQVTLANTLARRLGERFPGKDYQVTILAYGLSRPAPLAALPDDHVIVGNVASFFVKPDQVDAGSPSGATYRQQFLDWAKITKNHIWRPNTGDLAGFQRGGPVDTSLAIGNFRLLAETGCVGIVIDTIRHYWATQGPLYYLMAQLAWDPRRDSRAVLDDYYARGFGPAADEVRACWALMEEASRVQAGEGRAWREAFTPELFARADALLGQARAKTSGAPGAYTRRLDFVAAGLDFLRLKTENLSLIARLKETRGGDAEARTRALANWEEIVALGNRVPFALNSNDTRWAAPGNLWLIHPDHYERER